MFGQKRKRKKSPVAFEWANNNAKPRLNWKQMLSEGGTGVVKGLSRRVIVIKSPDARYFDEAIFARIQPPYSGRRARWLTAMFSPCRSPLKKAEQNFRQSSLQLPPMPVFWGFWRKARLYKQTAGGVRKTIPPPAAFCCHFLLSYSAKYDKLI